MDCHILIAEIRKRPALWDSSNVKIISHSARIPDLWKDVAQAVGVDVKECKRKWRYLRDAYRAEIKRIETRIENDMLRGLYNTKNNYRTKWVFFEPMSFINYTRKPRLNKGYENSILNDNNINNNNYDDFIYDTQYNNSISDVKLKCQDSTNKHVALSKNTDEVNNLLKESNCLNTLPALNRRPARITIKKGIDCNTQNYQQFNKPPYNEPQYLAMPQNINSRPSTVNKISQSQQQSHQPDDLPSTSESQNCGKWYQQHVDDQSNILENLEREEQILITLTDRDIITHSNKTDHISDSDYNYLVSFLPQMKKMSELQNLQFRAKMCEIALNVLAPSVNTTNPFSLPPS